jgi:hypothetical protein
MPSVDWSKTLDLGLAVGNVRAEFPGDWYRDPWGWPELAYMLKHAPQILYDNCAAHGARRVALMDVPKENWGARPAMVLDLVDRVVYQALVDRLSLLLIGDLSSSVFGWRLPPTGANLGVYSHNDLQWAAYRSHLGHLAAGRDVALRSDLVSFFASIPLDAVRDAVDDRAPKNAVSKRLFTFLDGIDRVPERSGLPQRSTASAVLANMLLRPIDDVLDHYATPSISSFLSGDPRQSFAALRHQAWAAGSNPCRSFSVPVEAAGEE